MDERAIQVTNEDMQTLKALLDARLNTNGRDQQHLQVLAQELDRADIVPSNEIASDVITLHSRVVVRDLDSGREATYTLSLPADAEATQNKISILAPLATALLGYREGDEIEWSMPGGKRRLKVVTVLYQPEAVEAATAGSAA